MKAQNTGLPVRSKKWQGRKHKNTPRPKLHRVEKVLQGRKKNCVGARRKNFNLIIKNRVENFKGRKHMKVEI